MILTKLKVYLYVELFCIQNSKTCRSMKKGASEQRKSKTVVLINQEGKFSKQFIEIEILK